MIIYQSGQENISTNVLFKDETFWMTQKDMATLFGVSLSSISRHLKNIFESHELNESVVIAEIAITTQHGALANKTQSSTVKLYNLDAIIAVGYRVNSKEATQFRIGVTKNIFQNYKLIKAITVYKEFNRTQKVFSDFDRLLQNTKASRT